MRCPGIIVLLLFAFISLHAENELVPLNNSSQNALIFKDSEDCDDDDDDDDDYLDCNRYFKKMTLYSMTSYF